MAVTRIIEFPAHKITCADCRLAAVCVPAHLSPEHVYSVEQFVRHAAPLRRGQTLFRTGERMRAVYSVRAGSVRSYYLTEDGREKVIAFHLPGEVLGFDGFETRKYRCTAEALETSAICELPVNELQALADRIPDLNHQLYRLMGAEIGRDQKTLLLLTDKNALERLAGFLLDLGERFASHGLSGQEFHLSMSRQNIANYLGLTIETVSRSFTQLQRKGLIAVRRRHIRIRDRERLGTLARACSAAPSTVAS